MSDTETHPIKPSLAGRIFLVGESTQPNQRVVDFSLVAWMVFLTFLFGVNIVAIKFVTNVVPPMMAAGMRGLIALAALTVYGLIKGERQTYRGPELWHALTIGLMFGLEFALIYLGAPLTSGGHVGIFINTAPFFVALGAHWFLVGDPLHPVKVAGLVVAFLGVMVLFSDELYVQNSGFWRGDLLVMAGAALWAATTLYMKRYMVASFNAFRLLHAQVLVSTLFLLALSFWLEPAPTQALDMKIMAILSFQGLVVVFFSYLMWMHLLRIYPASGMQSFTFLTPVWGVAASVVLLNENASMLLLAGMILVGLGLYLVSRPRSR